MFIVIIYPLLKKWRETRIKGQDKVKALRNENDQLKWQLEQLEFIKTKMAEQRESRTATVCKPGIQSVNCMLG